MPVVALVLIIVGVYGAYCGVESFNPVALLTAMMQNPSGINDLIIKEKAYRDATGASNATSSASAGSSGGASAPSSLDYSLGIVAGQNSVAPANSSLGAFEKANAATLSSQSSSAAAISVYQSYAEMVLADTYHITDAQDQQDIISLWNRESGWRPTADNASSDAFGIPQALPATKIPGGKSSTAQQQIDWGLGYIVQRYGTPVQAWAHETSAGWY